MPTVAYEQSLKKGTAVDESSGMYELEFPIPDLTSEDGTGPVLVHGLEGFTDAGHAVRLATAHLREVLGAELVVTFAVDKLIDYRSRRPVMTFKNNQFTSYTTPKLELHALRDTAGTVFLLLSGLEPDLSWEQFTTAVRLLIERFGVTRTIGLNAIPMAVPHTRPIGVTAHSSNTEVTGDYQKWDGEITIPGSADALLELRLSEHEHPTLGFAVHVPHYLAQSDYPEAAQKMLECLIDNTGLEIPLSALGDAAARVREQVEQQIRGNEEVESVVSALENQYDAYITAEERRASLLAESGDLPSGDELGAEFEKFLADRAEGNLDSGSGHNSGHTSGHNKDADEDPDTGEADDGPTP